MSKGVTLIELLIALSVGAIIIVFALPSFQSIVQNNRAQQLTSDWAGALRYARSEAIRRAHSVSICAAANDQYTSCGSNWENGWIIFPNANADTVFNNNETEFALRVHSSLSKGELMSTAPNTTIVTFTSRGFPTASTSGVSTTISATSCSGANTHIITILATGDISIATSNCP